MSRSAAALFGARDVPSDEGFTFVELLVALSLLLITLVAVTGLSMTSSFMASAARQRAAMVNASAGYLERVRQEPYASVGTPGGDPSGVLVAAVTTSDPYTIAITPEVSWGRPEDPTNGDFKTVTLSVSSTNAQGGSLMMYETAAVFADVGVVGSTPAATVATPTIVVSSPQDDSIVWGGSVSVVASAAVGATTRSLVWLELFDGTTSWGSVAITGVSAQHTYAWNTANAREGRHRLTPRVTDNTPMTADGTPITVTVDNTAPGQPGGLGAGFATGSAGQLWWDAAYDGTDVDGTTPLAANHYMVTVYRQPSAASLAADYKQWTSVTGLTGLSVPAAPSQVAPLALSGLAGFSRYCAAVAASSPDRGTASGLLAVPVTVVGSTKATAAGSWKITYASKKYTQTVTVNVPTGPTFPWSGTATTRIYRLTAPTQSIISGVLIKTVSSSSPNWVSTAGVDVLTSSTNGQPTAYWYGAVTTLTPQGYGALSTAVASCVVGPPADMTSTGTRPLVIAQW